MAMSLHGTVFLLLLLISPIIFVLGGGSDEKEERQNNSRKGSSSSFLGKTLSAGLALQATLFGGASASTLTTNNNASNISNMTTYQPATNATNHYDPKTHQLNSIPSTSTYQHNISAVGAKGVPITKAFPKAPGFQGSDAIMVTGPTTMYGVPNVYRMLPFQGKQSVRNHFGLAMPRQNIEYLIIHLTFGNLGEAMESYTYPASFGKSVHFVVLDQQSTGGHGSGVVQVVPEDKQAWHVSSKSGWRQHTNLQANSLAIALVNKGLDSHGQYLGFDEEQLIKTGQLAKQLVKKYNIDPLNVVGHEDVSPGPRADGPGPAFTWNLLYKQYGLGMWLDTDEQSIEVIQKKYHPHDPTPPFPRNGQKRREEFMKMANVLGWPNPADVRATDSDVIKAFKAHFTYGTDAYDDVVTKYTMFWAWALKAKYVDGKTGAGKDGN